jgi:hypothetical protein
MLLDTAQGRTGVNDVTCLTASSSQPARLFLSFQRPNKSKMKLDTEKLALRPRSPFRRAWASSPMSQPLLGSAAPRAPRAPRGYGRCKALAETPYPPSALSTPVYSLATVGGADGQNPTLNLVTYASPISLTPRHYALGLYVNTLSWENFLSTGRGVLQVRRGRVLRRSLRTLMHRRRGARQVVRCTALSNTANKRPDAAGADPRRAAHRPV